MTLIRTRKKRTISSSGGNTNVHWIKTGETYSIAETQDLLVSGTLPLDGELRVDGKLSFLGGATDILEFFDLEWTFESERNYTMTIPMPDGDVFDILVFDSEKNEVDVLKNFSGDTVTLESNSDFTGFYFFI